MPRPGYCTTCQNTGMIDCHCGGDLCVCGEEELPCPDCQGEHDDLLADIAAEDLAEDQAAGL